MHVILSCELQYKQCAWYLIKPHNSFGVSNVFPDSLIKLHWAIFSPSVYASTCVALNLRALTPALNKRSSSSYDRFLVSGSRKYAQVAVSIAVPNQKKPARPCQFHAVGFNLFPRLSTCLRHRVTAKSAYMYGLRIPAII